MKKTKKSVTMIVVLLLIIIAIFSLVMYIRFLTAFKAEPDGSAAGYNVIAAETTISVSDDAAVETEVTTTHTYTDEDFDVDEDFLYTPYGLFDETDNTEGLLGEIRRFNIDALTVKFDNIDFKPGMRVSNIIDNSYWYTNRENETIEAGAADFVRLDNDFWNSTDIKLIDKKDVVNGDVILFIHNYSDTAQLIRDCVVYKFQISYVGCWDCFSEHPAVEYNNYTWGSNVTETTDDIYGVQTDRGDCTRYQYGDLTECQVLLDTDDDGLRAITVVYNEYYGPDFSKGGDNNGE